MTASPRRKAPAFPRFLVPCVLTIALAACQPGGGDASDASDTDTAAAPAAAPAGVAPPAAAPAGAAVLPESSGIHVEQPWIRATAPNAPAAGGYLQLHNAGPGEDRLLSVTTEAAARAEIHEVTEVDGVMRMRPLADGLALPAGATVSLAPGGNHLMLLDLAEPLVEGDRVEATLRFARAPEQRVIFDVRSLTAAAGDAGHAH